MPFKDFAAGDILTAADVDNLLMRQTVMKFDDVAARDTALVDVLTKGMFCFLDDTSAFQFYTGSASQDVSNPGDITAVTAGTALSGGLFASVAGYKTGDAVFGKLNAYSLSW